MDAYEEFEERHPWATGYGDSAQRESNRLNNIIANKQNELLQTMNNVANKYIKWSLAKDKFISEVIAYSSDIIAKTNTGEFSLPEAVSALDNEIASLKEQDRILTSNRIKQAIILKREVIEEFNKNKIKENKKIVIAAIGFVSGGLQTVAGLGLIETGPAGGLMLAHGFNNTFENGYYLLYREDYVGPVRFVYRGLAKQLLNIDESGADVLYSTVDISVSLNSLFGYRLEPDLQRLFRYIDADLITGLTKKGIRLMTAGDIFLEIVGDYNTAYGQYLSYKG
ncbi:DUF4225 domain-containing protein [Yersinia sp. J1]|uniref:DUF4225 domain-containing protein n=1 Tax=Yersinia sp. J1 TaxID=3424774 RepID=UPI003D35B01E